MTSDHKLSAGQVDHRLFIQVALTTVELLKCVYTGSLRLSLIAQHLRNNLAKNTVSSRDDRLLTV